MNYEKYVLDNVFMRENKRRGDGGEDAFTNQEEIMCGFVKRNFRSQTLIYQGGY
jgi:hypothetical protein